MGKKWFSMAKTETYFQDGAEFRFHDPSKFPSNAAALVEDGTIQVLEVVEDGDEEGQYLAFIKMKIKGITVIVHLQHNGFDGTTKFLEIST